VKLLLLILDTFNTVFISSMTAAFKAAMKSKKSPADRRRLIQKL
jgi:hypothetical protein